MNNFKFYLEKYRRIYIIILHLFIVAFSYALSFLLRFEFRIPHAESYLLLRTIPFLLLIKLPIFYYFGVFHGIWQYASMDDLWQILKANFIATVVFILGEVFVFGLQGFPRSVFVSDFLVCTILVAGVRFAARLFKERYQATSSEKRKQVLIVGAGEAGILLLKELRHNHSMGEVVGFIDDDRNKLHQTIHGIKVLGGRKNIPSIVDKFGIEEIIIAMPSAKGEVIRDIISYCQSPDVKLKIIPGLQKIINGDLEVKPRAVMPEDLLGRETVSINEQDIKSYIKDKKVMVTGAGGSIGSELVRQIARFRPRKIILFDHNENNVYFLTVELRDKYPDIRFRTVIGDIRDIGKLKHTFNCFRPEVIFHAAAHKHVPLMEENPVAAVKNNVIGSRNLIYAANHYGVERFVLISTDKAVNPINVMGMSKRIAEMILQAKAKGSKTKFMAVRFGNVIGSDGSVVPLFKKQIEDGGPITVTHPEVRRYFMSVKEAVLLVLQAGALGKGGELFILDMGEQIKILDIAKNLVALSGLKLDKDISIKFTGLRPGEKLFEELLLDKEKDKVTRNDKIYISQSQDLDPIKLRRKIKTLERLCDTMDEAGAIVKMKEIIAE